MNYVIASLLVLAVGPILHHGLKSQKGIITAIGAFVMVSLGGLVLFDVLPQVITLGGVVAILFVLLGLFGPSLSEKLFKRHSAFAHNLTVALGIFGLLLHAVTDGSALFLAANEQGPMLLAFGIILHRMPAGLAVWWLLRPAYGRAIATVVLGLMMIATLIGFHLGPELLHHMTATHVVYLQAFVTGSILHVLWHRPHEHHSHEHDHGGQATLQSSHWIGGGLGLLFLVLLMVAHPDHGHSGASDHLHGEELHQAH
ncbi:hypothetical protein FCL40_18010 [Ferrimonas sediminicola]|uniref:Zinc transporter ZupT n=1 Tax=Ferrimonas sediminicola TaxID=2569538 RepID=A0A4V5NUP8_9GAMM|nr:hypothetical protein [Ferrimonas sediminicola]TKB46236.1 hypothetical protein FCL40_18010 [Ferrimonas sediminicola]